MKYSISFPGRVQILEDRSLRLDGVTLDDIGEYSCEADNAVGSVTATGTLYVHCKEIEEPLVDFDFILIFFVANSSA